MGGCVDLLPYLRMPGRLSCTQYLLVNDWRCRRGNGAVLCVRRRVLGSVIWSTLCLFRYLEGSGKHTLQCSTPLAVGFLGSASPKLFRQAVERRSLTITTIWMAEVGLIMDGVITFQELPASADAAYSHKIYNNSSCCPPSTRIPNV